MPLRRPLAASYGGLLLIGGAGAISLGGLSAIMLFLRAQCEPVLRWLLLLLLGGRAQYYPHSYYFYVGLVAFLAIWWIALVGYVIWRKPSEDRHIDAALEAHLRQSAHGAPLEPE